MKIIPVTQTNSHIYHDLIQSYEAEFSPLTGKKPDDSGRYELDTHLGENVLGYLLEVDDTPAAIAAIGCKKDRTYEVCEFYVIPSFRKNAIGMCFAHAIWQNHPGTWEIKQIEGADYATRFWRKTISRFRNTAYAEELYCDPYWGNVTRQRFSVHSEKGMING